jgi:hypothetical protein
VKSGSEGWYAASLQDAGIVFVWSPGAMPQAGMELRRWRAGRERGVVRASAEPRIFGLVGRGAGTRTPCARESCDCSQQSRVSVTPRFEEIARTIDVIAGKLWPL